MNTNSNPSGFAFISRISSGEPCRSNQPFHRKRFLPREPIRDWCLPRTCQRLVSSSPREPLLNPSKNGKQTLDSALHLRGQRITVLWNDHDKHLVDERPNLPPVVSQATPLPIFPFCCGNRLLAAHSFGRRFASAEPASAWVPQASLQRTVRRVCTIQNRGCPTNLPSGKCFNAQVPFHGPDYPCRTYRPMISIIPPGERTPLVVGTRSPLITHTIPDRVPCLRTGQAENYPDITILVEFDPDAYSR